MSASLGFAGGTLVLYDSDGLFPPPPAAPPLPVFRWIKGRWRCEAYHYGALQRFVAEYGLRDSVPRWERLALALRPDAPEAHDYQTAALAAWERANRQGSIVLPTGAGKTFVAIHAIQRVGRSALVVAPTLDLLHQWYARLSHLFGVEVGVYYGGEKTILPLTVTTYHSAGDVAASCGHQFKLVIFDEVHHLPAPMWGEAALMSPAPYRLGLTATYPGEDEQTGGRWRVDELVGDVVYALRIDDLAGEQLAAYRTERVRVDLTPDEQRAYDADHALYSAYVEQHDLRRHGRYWVQALMRKGATDPAARAALLARNRLLRLVARCEQKQAALERLLREYRHEQCLIFTDYNDEVYAIARRHLVPALTHETHAAERKAILDGFREGSTRAIVTSRVLNEGIDVPEAKVAIVLGGTANARTYIQRLGRVLRKVGSRQAVLYEVLARGTIDDTRARRRRAEV